jgi:hypothetical protein
MSRLRDVASAILRQNDRGGHTVPAPSLYPHQWNWDSAFCAIGWAWLDPRRAATELARLFRGQWDDGLVPHIVFDPGAEHYEPGPATWKTIDAKGAPTAARASSITQPPLAATAARIVLERSGGDAEVEHTLRAIVEPLERWHAWFATVRTPPGAELPCIVHPWESGMDNAPRWDRPLANVVPGAVEYKRKDDTIVDPSERPTRYDYDRYFWLVAERARLGFAPPVRETEPFLVEDIGIASILCRAEDDLAALAGALGQSGEGARRRHATLSAALGIRTGGDGRAFDRDVKTGELLETRHVATYLPLYAGVVPSDVAARAAGALATALPARVPSLPPDDPAFDPRRYWRGPTWVNVNWLLIEGLARTGHGSAAADLAAHTVDLVRRSGFREYFHPLTGEGLGAHDFAWTAALAIDLEQRYA